MLDDLLTTHSPSDRARPLLLPSPEEERLARLCYAMTWFEEVYRTGRLWPGRPLGDAGPGFSVSDLLDAVPAFAVSDIVAQVSLALGALGPLRAACPASSVYLMRWLMFADSRGARRAGL